MKRGIIGLFFFVLLTSFSAHKFYVSIYQVQYAPEKKMLQITARIFVDDLNKILEQSYAHKTHVGEPSETKEDIALMNKYLLDRFFIQINGKPKTIVFVNHEMENNVMIGYYKIIDVATITTLQIKNTALIDLNSNQQNIIQANFNGKKQSLLLTSETTFGMLN